MSLVKREYRRGLRGQPCFKPNKSISSERKRKKIMNKLVVDLLQQKGLGC